MNTTPIKAPRSKYIKSFEWLDKRISYPEKDIKGDSFPMTWANDGEIYTSCGDPVMGDKLDGLDIQKICGTAPDYRIKKVNSMSDYTGWGGKGPKPSGMICVDGVLYLAFQNLLGEKPGVYGTNCQHGSDAHIICSFDYGKTWTPNIKDIAAPMFPGSIFGGPAFINFGKNNANARDSYVYAVSNEQWNNGSNVRLGRVPSDEIMNKSAWQWVNGWTVNNSPTWSNNMEAAIPILNEHRYIGIPEMVYNAAIDRYLLLTWHLHEDDLLTAYNAGSDLIIFESPEPWGPFSLVKFEEYWEDKLFTPYCPRIPLKWLEADGESGYMQFSGSWGNSTGIPLYGEIVPTPYYRSNIRSFELKLY